MATSAERSTRPGPGPGRAALEAALALVAMVLGAALGCPSGDPRLRKAEEVRERWVQSDDEYRRYDLEISREAADPGRRARLMQALEDGSLRIAMAAVEALGESPPAESRDPLSRVFANRKGALKLHAAMALGRLGDEAALEYLREQMSDEAQPLSIPAVQVLATLGEAAVRPILERRVTSDRLEFRDEVYAALGQIGEPWATAMLVEGLRREHGEQRRQAIAALGRTGDPRVASDIDRFVNTQGLVFVTLEALGALGNPQSAAAVRSMAQSEESSVRAFAGAALWRLGREDEARALLEPLVHAENPAARGVLAQQIAGLETADARGYLLALARDPDKSVRIAALRSLGVTLRPEDQVTLLEAARDSDYEVQTLALNLLARVGETAALETVSPLVDSDNPYVALAAAHAMTEIVARARAS